jgi:uncharacterized protein (TIGR02118 family)
MVKLTVLYRHPEDPAAFEEYYANTHMVLVDKMRSFQRYEVALSTPEGQGPSCSSLSWTRS